MGAKDHEEVSVGAAEFVRAPGFRLWKLGHLIKLRKQLLNRRKKALR